MKWSYTMELVMGPPYMLSLEPPVTQMFYFTTHTDLSYVGSVLPSATMVKTKVNSQLKIFAIVHSQATIFLGYTCGKIGQGQGKF